ncbi:MAG: 50S ribosomal protein L20 [Patescibacteria group bacterium]|jgi:large subunit ribosomal protein L20
MPRVKRGTAHIKKRKNLLKKTKGYMWGRSKKVKQAKEAILHAGLHARHDRRAKKGVHRSLWQVKLNAAVREHGLNYSTFINKLKVNKIELNRKVLSEMATQHPVAFTQLVKNLK